MAAVFRAPTCVMVTSPGSGTSHPNTLPLGKRRGDYWEGGGEGQGVAEGDVVSRVHCEL